jgi:hypothetical protein
MVLNFYHKSLREALRFRLRHIDGQVTLAAFELCRAWTQREVARRGLSWIEQIRGGLNE